MSFSVFETILNNSELWIQKKIGSQTKKLDPKTGEKNTPATIK